MIKNSRQASVSKKTREELLHAAEQAPLGRKSSYLGLAEEIGRDLDEYEAIQDGRINLFDVADIDELGASLVKARLARGWTHRKLAEALQVSEQMVQKDEARLYEHAGLARMAEVADVLGYGLTGALRPIHLPERLWKAAPVSATMNVAFVTSSSWTSPMSIQAGYVISGLFNVQPIAYGTILGSATYLTGKLAAGNLYSQAFVNVGRSTNALDSGANVPLELSGVTS